MKNGIVFIISAVLLITITNIKAQDWPQFLGPERNSTSPQKGLLRSWPKDGPEVLWTVNTGIGFGGPVVKDGKVYLLDRNDRTGDNMRCFDLSTGKELWSFAYAASGSVPYPGSRSVPAVDGNRVYSVGPYGDFYCIDINTHKPLWKKNIWKDYGGAQIPKWAISQCPLIYGDLVIVASQAPQAGVVAYDKLSGNVRWKTPSLGAIGYVSPAMVKIGGKNQVVMITAASGSGPNASGGKVVGIDPLNGKVLWIYKNWNCAIPVPSAYDVGENRVMIIGGYNAGAAMIRIDRKADGSYGVTELYKNVDFGDHTKPPILYNGYFYAQYSINERRDGLVCMSIDGKVLWKTMRAPSFDKGCMILADGLILATDGSKTLYLIQPDPSGFKPLASAELLRAGQNWAPIALSDGKLLIKDQSRMLCVKVAR
jgi:outer membrane protein assembly factor BamB